MNHNLLTRRNRNKKYQRTPITTSMTSMTSLTLGLADIHYIYEN